jgi:hypothetical protein
MRDTDKERALLEKAGLAVRDHPSDEALAAAGAGGIWPQPIPSLAP